MGKYKIRPQLPFRFWPISDQTGWTNADRCPTTLDDGGILRRWAPSTRLDAFRVYGGYLKHLTDVGMLRNDDSNGIRYSDNAICSYARVRMNQVCDQTIASELKSIARAIKAIDASVDRAYINSVANRFLARVTPTRLKTGRVIQPTQLYEFGLNLIEEAKVLRNSDPGRIAARYRTGLSVTFLSFCPIRSKNVCEMKVGQHLVRGAKNYLVRFSENEMKGCRSLEVCLPENMTTLFDDYLQNYRPNLVRGKIDEGFLFLNLKGDRMNGSSLCASIRNLSGRRIGVLLTPHLFRDAAATFISETQPEMAPMAASVLHHTRFKITQNHYIHGQQHLASIRFHEAIDDLLVQFQRALPGVMRSTEYRNTTKRA